MRKRDIKIGMRVKHKRSGKYLGVVSKIGKVAIRLDGPCPLATAAEIEPA